MLISSRNYIEDFFIGETNEEPEFLASIPDFKKTFVSKYMPVLEEFS